MSLWSIAISNIGSDKSFADDLIVLIRLTKKGAKDA
jgi:hypothetical protein